MIHFHQPSLSQRSFIKGFTLIELMVSLVLGLLIVGAVMQIYVSSVKTTTLQRSASDVQDSSIFGIQALEAKLRIANLGSGKSTNITDTTVSGGIVLTPTNIGDPAYTDLAALTSSTGDKVGSGSQWTGISDMASSSSQTIGVGSDQLTIQYKNITGDPASAATAEPIMDCEGEAVAPNDIAIERYFMRDSTTPGVGKVVACDAGRIVGGKISAKPSFGSSTDKGDEFILNVNQFKILLGTQSLGGDMIYYTPNAYKTLTVSPKPPIIAVKVALVARGSKPIIADAQVTSFKIFGSDQVLSPTAQSVKYVRKAYESTTMLRNARVVTLATTPTTTPPVTP